MPTPHALYPAAATYSGPSARLPWLLPRWQSRNGRPCWRGMALGRSNSSHNNYCLLRFISLARAVFIFLFRLFLFAASLSALVFIELVCFFLIAAVLAFLSIASVCEIPASVMSPAVALAYGTRWVLAPCMWFETAAGSHNALVALRALYACMASRQ